MTPQEQAQHAKRLEDDGYTLVENAIAPDLIDALNEALVRLERELEAKPAGNLFEGSHTVRIYNLLAYGAPFSEVPTHPNVLPLIETVLDKECLVSSLSSIAIDPGESAQPIHSDDQLFPVAKPHVPFVCNSMWALSDFTEANGATRIVPGTHKGPSPDYGESYDSIAAEMPKGSVLIWNGALWHGGGANRTDKRRTGIAMNYCAGFVRQQENQQLGIPREVAAGFSPRLQELIGYGVYRDLMGHIDKQTPAQRLLGVEADFKSVWDR